MITIFKFVQSDVRIYNRENKILYSIFLIPISILIFVGFLNYKFHAQIQIKSAMIVLFLSSYFLSIFMHNLFNGWGIKLKDATPFPLSIERITLLKNYSALFLLLLSNLIIALSASIYFNFEIHSSMSDLLYAFYVSLLAIYSWNFLHVKVNKLAKYDFFSFIIIGLFLIIGTIVFVSLYNYNMIFSLILTFLIFIRLFFFAISNWGESLEKHKFDFIGEK